jgi:hypothetical protein
MLVSLILDEGFSRLSTVLLGDNSAAMDDIPFFSSAGAQVWQAKPGLPLSQISSYLSLAPLLCLSLVTYHKGSLNETDCLNSGSQYNIRNYNQWTNIHYNDDFAVPGCFFLQQHRKPEWPSKVQTQGRAFSKIALARCILVAMRPACALNSASGGHLCLHDMIAKKPNGGLMHETPVDLDI